KLVDAREEVIREAVTRDDLLVERVPVNQPLEAPLSTRVEDDWLVIPIMEEVVVVQKRLMLKEEIRIRKRQVEEVSEVRETVRSGGVELEDGAGHGVAGLEEALRAGMVERAEVAQPPEERVSSATDPLLQPDADVTRALPVDELRRWSGQR